MRQDLQRHVPVELDVSGSVHLAHAAFADLGGDGVVAERGTDRQRHEPFESMVGPFYVEAVGAVTHGV